MDLSSFGLGFLCAWFYASFLSSLVAPVPSHASAHLVPVAWVCFQAGSVVVFLLLIGFERRVGQICARRPVQLLSLVCMVGGEIMVAVSSLAPVGSAFVFLRPVGAFISSAGFAPLLVAWGMTFGARGANEAEGLIPANLFLAMLLTLGSCLLGGFAGAAVRMLFALIAYCTLCREWLRLGMDAFCAQAEERAAQNPESFGFAAFGISRVIAAVHKGESFDEANAGASKTGSLPSLRVMFALAVALMAFTVLRARVMFDGVLSDSSHFIGLFAIGTLAAAVINFAFLFYAKRITLFAILRIACPLLCASLLVLMVCDTAYAGVAFAVGLVAYLCLDVFAWVGASALVRSGRVGPTVALASVRVLFPLGALLGLAVLMGLPAAVSNVAVAGVILALFVTAMLAVPDQGSAESALAPIRHENEKESAEPSGSFEMEFEARCMQVCERYGLSAREKDVFLLLGRGRDAPYIREALFISRNTVNTHVKHIYRKMGIHSKQELLDMLKEGE